MDLEKNKQRLEIMAAQIEELKRNGGGGGTPTESDDFTPDNITIEDGGTFPSGSTERLTKHLPLEINDTLYYFLEETGVDYLYGSLPTSGAFPTITYFRVMKGSFTVEFHQTAIETVPTEDSTNLITSGGVYDALQNAGGGLPAYVNMPTGSNAYFPEDKMEILEKHLPFTTTNPPTSTSSLYLFIGNYGGSYIYKKFANDGFTETLEINQSTRKITSTTKSGSGTIYDVNSTNYMRYILNRPSDTVSGQSDLQKQILFLGQNANLDNQNYTSYPKMVVCNSDATAATLTNCPTDKAFYMFNDYYAFHPTQTIFESNNPAIFYRRTFVSNSWTDWHSFGCDYFNPTDETLVDGGTISATALANALKHVPLSFNAHLCYYSYEDTNNVYYVSTRLNGASLHTNVVAINKTTGVATFNEFDQS